MSTIQQQAIKALFVRCFNAFTERIVARPTHQMPWLCEAFPEPLSPDYLRIGTFGRTRVESWINRQLARYCFPVWKRCVWPRAIDFIMVELETKYLPVYLQACNDKDERLELRRLFIRLFNRYFGKPPKIMREATSIDLFYALFELLDGVAEIVGGQKDVYQKEKAFQNQICTRIYTEIREEILSHPMGLDLMLYLAVRANWIDLVEDKVDVFLEGFREEVNELLDGRDTLAFQRQHNPFFQLSAVVFCLEECPKTILYELDNCGEVVMDLLLVELLIKRGHLIILAARGKPVLNDVTVDDLTALLAQPEFVSLAPALESGQISIVSSGSLITGKYVWEAPQDYQDAYQAADMLILKGQGNFQTMPMLSATRSVYPYKKPMVYMMGVKAKLISYCMDRLFIQSKPLPQSLFLYYFHPQNQSTHPK